MIFNQVFNQSRGLLKRLRSLLQQVLKVLLMMADGDFILLVGKEDLGDTAAVV